MQQKSGILLVVLSLFIVSCSDYEVTSGVDQCGTVALPLSGSAGAPNVIDVGLEVQAGGIVVVATATDPQGSENMRDVLQTIGVFPDDQCAGMPIVLEDDIASLGVEETFGTAVSASQNPSLYDAIAAADSWPVEIDFADVDGNRTSGRVLARVIP